MRVSDQQVISWTQFQMNADYESMAQAQTVLASGRQINTPADNPTGTAIALRLQASLAQSNQFSTTANDTQTWLQTTDTSLSGVSDALLQARTLAVQGANGTLTTDQRQAIAANVQQLVQQAVQSANGTYAGHYVLSGQQINTAPFTLGQSGGLPTVTYNGDTRAITREVSPNQMMQINVDGNSTVMPAFQAMIQLQSDLQANNPTAVSNDLTQIDAAQSTLLLGQATVGASLNRTQALQQSLQTTQENLTSQISNLVDADMAKASVDFTTRQATYQASLDAASKVIQKNLLDFLR